MYSRDEQPRARVHADRQSIAAGRDVTIAEGARVTLGDHHEHRGAYSDNDPEWKAPPYGSGLVLCPSCRRAHFNEDAVDCPRCHYPHREKQLAARIRMQQEYAQRQAYRLLCAVVGMASVLVAYAYGLVSAQQIFPAVAGAMVTGFFVLFPFLEWLNCVVRDHLET